MSGTSWGTAVTVLGAAAAACAVLISIRADRSAAAACAGLDQRLGDLSGQCEQMGWGIQMAAGQDVPQPRGLRVIKAG
jgi:hypothetical protein